VAVVSARARHPSHGPRSRPPAETPGPSRTRRSASPRRSVTVHDVGVNHVGTFQSLLQVAGPSDLVTSELCFYHIDLPGHSSGAGEPAGAVRDGQFSVDDIAGVVGAVVSHFNLREPLGMGVGLGALALALHGARAEAAGRGRLCGLVLISPAVRRAGMWEGWYGRAACASLRVKGHNHVSTSYVLQRLFANGVQSAFRMENDLERTHRGDVTALDADVLRRYLDAGLSRDGSLLSAELLRGLTEARVLLVVGEGSTFEGEGMELSEAVNAYRVRHGMKPRGSMTVVRVAAAGTLVPVQRPDAVIPPLRGFLQHLQQLGYCMS